MKRRPLRIALIALLVVVVLVVGAGAVFVASFDPNAYKPDIIAAVKRATGRDLALNGKISLKLSLAPTIQVADATFSNPPGYSRPMMASLQGLELQLALLPLLSKTIEIDRLVLVHPDILLETDAAGHPNWQMTPEVSPAAPAGSQAPAKPADKAATAVSVGSVSIRDGTLGYRDDATGKVTTLGLPKLDATADSADAPLHIATDASYNGTAFNLTGDTGSLTRLQDAAATSPWPVKLALNVVGAKLTADGSMSKPLLGKGYDLAVTGSVPDVSALTPLLQGFVPPPLHDVNFAAKIADTGGTLPAFSALTLHVGASDLGQQMPGLTITKLDVSAPGGDAPIKVDGSGKLADQPMTLAATGGAIGLLLPGAKPAQFPLDATFQAAGATISAKGTIANAQALSGANLALAAQIPDLAALSPLARTKLPPLKQVAFASTLTDAAGGLRDGATLHGITLTSSGGDLSGDVAVVLHPRLAMAANLRSNRIDLDAVQAAAGPPPAPDPSGPKPPPLPKRNAGEHLISDQPIPFDQLRNADADLKLAIADLHSAGVNYKAITTHVALTNGKLTADPFAADLPEGHLAGTLTADASQPAPPVHLTMHAPGLAMASVLTAMRQPAYASGKLEVYADLHGAGVSPHAIASSLNGYLGLALANGTIDNRLLGSVLGHVLESVNALDLVGKGGLSELKCLGFRMDAQHGVGNIKALALSSSLLTMTGSGSVNLGPETMALDLRTRAKVGAAGLVIPLEVSGPIAAPKVGVNRLGVAESNAGSVATAVIANGTPLGVVGGLLGGDKLLGNATADICPPALAAARGQAVAEAVPPSGGNPKPVPPANPAQVLQNLFR